ncbi:hypothetical protein FGG08_005851 [Glutinoglossum americanum]|uniref:Uncharacterized protein n=1 Tax=Glutinoglossum americanum TaxID=1670608 RepID=A0A9P8HZJ4_9PEZI|nr:hypothetical protein FGG08_005851 [Glutinoglossum americanum]
MPSIEPQSATRIYLYTFGNFANSISSIRANATSVSRPRPHAWICPTATQVAANTRQGVETHSPSELPAAGCNVPQAKGLSRRRAKARRKSPSTILIEALKSIGQFQALPPRYREKLDLSYGPAWQPLPSPKRYEIYYDPRQIRGTSDSALELSLPLILASYLTNLYPLLNQDSVFLYREHNRNGRNPSRLQLDARISEVFGSQNTAFLAQRGFDAADVMIWAWILTGRTTKQALLRLFAAAACRSPRRDVREAIPTFVFLFLLRRRHISAESLKLCLIHAWDRLENRNTALSAITRDQDVDEALRTGPYQISHRLLGAHMHPRSHMDEKSVQVMVIRLLRHARRVWAASMVNISRMISKHVNGGVAVNEALKTRKTAARLTLFYNRSLSLISLPSIVNPFLSVPYHQRAQFHLIRRMAEFDPPLPINKEGYRAVIRVQLAHRKTLRERQWADLKSKSWPPWKEDKTGLDVDKGLEHGTSRAKEALTRMKEAGYAPGTLGKVANIFAGWDTDGSPTIQTRTQLSKIPPTKEDIWAARVRSTRTANEAWACFLARRDEMLPPSEGVYHAMFEKLIFERKRKKTGKAKDASTSHPLESDVKTYHFPGDGKEVFPQPISPNEAIYLRSQLPSVKNLYDQMCLDGIHPTGRFLELLISHAESVTAGLKYMSSYGDFGPRPLSSSLLCSDLANQPRDSPASILLKDVPEHTFAAFIKLLCRFPQARYRQRRDAKTYTSPVVLAFRLMLLRQPKYRPAWNSLLHALAQPKIALTDPDTANVGGVRYLHDIMPWELMVQLVDQMRSLDLSLDEHGFLALCNGLEKAVLASLQAEKSASPLVRGEVEGVLEKALKYLRSAFRNLVGADAEMRLGREEPSNPRTNLPDEADKYLQLPSLLVVPGPVQLHAYIRVLGLLQDYEELLALVRWIVKFSPEIDIVVDEANNGRRMLRRAIVAARVFLEHSWEKMEVEEGTGDRTALGWGADTGIREQVKATVESVESWGGWPRDDEVALYCQRGRFPHII